MTNLPDLAVTVVLIAVLVALLRWTWGRGHSLVAQPPRHGAPGDYGLLVPVSAPESPEHARAQARTLAEAGIRHTVAATTAGLRVLVWPDDAGRAHRALTADRPEE